MKLALEWLARHQHPDGRWDCDGFEDRCRLNKCGGVGQKYFDCGCTGLAVLAFLNAGNTHRAGVHQAVVRRGLKYLKSIQSPEGRFGTNPSNRFVYDHAIGTLAMARAYALTGSILFKTPAQKGVDYIEKCRNPYLGWRYGVRPQDNDTSVTGWMVVALAAARDAKGLRVPKAAFEGARVWFEKVTDPEYGRVGYTARGTGPVRPQELMDLFPSQASESLTAVGMYCRMLLGEDPKQSEIIAKGAELCLKVLPEWNPDQGTIDMTYWYFGTLAMARVGGEPWMAWRMALRTAVRNRQRRDGDERGSWDPVGPWIRMGGRVASTAKMALVLIEDQVRQSEHPSR